MTVDIEIYRFVITDSGWERSPDWPLDPPEDLLRLLNRAYDPQRFDSPGARRPATVRAAEAALADLDPVTGRINRPDDLEQFLPVDVVTVA